MIILPPPRISNAGGFLNSDAIDVEHMQQRRFVAIHIGAYLTKGFLVQMERYLERGVVTPEADAALRRIVISACVRKMEGGIAHSTLDLWQRSIIDLLKALGDDPKAYTAAALPAFMLERAKRLRKKPGAIGRFRARPEPERLFA